MSVGLREGLSVEFLLGELMASVVDWNLVDFDGFILKP
jgi:hypothetical protein